MPESFIQTAAEFHLSKLDNATRWHEKQGIGEIHQTVNMADSVNAGPIIPKGGRKSVLVEAQGLVHGDRNEQYGAPITEYTRTAGMVNAMLAHKLKEPLAPEDVPLIMCCLKMSRQMNKAKRDTLVDLAGYAEVAQWILDAKAGQE